MRGSYRVRLNAWFSLALLSALATAAPTSAAWRVQVVSFAAEDPRIAQVRDAIDFWRNTFAELGLPEPLVEGGVLVQPAGGRALENFAWQISRLAGRLPDDASDGPSPPPELLALDGEVVVLLSGQPLLPFTRPLPEPGRYLVAIAGARELATHSGPDRNVVAHELGHALGLRHGNDPTALMCEPCPNADGGLDAPFRPLTAADRARLVELYGRAP
jgi:hypothetical protein